MSKRAMTKGYLDLPHIVSIMATCGRHTLAERAMKMWIDQDYEGNHTLLIFNNSEVKTELDPGLKLDDNQQIILWNNHIDTSTGEPYTSLGAIYNDALKFLNDIPAQDSLVGHFDIVTHHDDDDLYMPNHLTQGMLGMEAAKKMGMEGYKPQASWYRHKGGLVKMENNMEPSVFLTWTALNQRGYSDTTTEQHLQWYGSMMEEKKIFVDPKGESTLIYNWGDTIPTYKTSGDFKNPMNFNNVRKSSYDHGDKMFTPWPDDSVKPYYDAIRDQ